LGCFDEKKPGGQGFGINDLTLLKKIFELIERKVLDGNSFVVIALMMHVALGGYFGEI
jgi:hypothetical protein